MKVTDVIRRPLVTEKTTIAREKTGEVIVFEVARDATKVDIRRPLKTAKELFSSKWFALGMGIATSAWIFHVAALAVAPISVVQVVLASGVVMIGVMADRMFGVRVGNRQWWGLALTALGLILLAITFPMFWSKLIFSLFSDLLLQADALLVSLVLGLPRAGNVITLSDGISHLWIAAPCSSLANVSLAVLGWTLFLHTHHGRGAPGLRWGLLCCGLIVVLNVGRISLIGLYPGHYDLIHGAVGASLASWLMVAAVFGTLTYGARHAA